MAILLKARPIVARRFAAENAAWGPRIPIAPFRPAVMLVSIPHGFPGPSPTTHREKDGTPWRRRICMKELKSYSDRELIKGYIGQAAWFWFDASTEEKKLEVGLHRLVARCIYDEIQERGLEEPDFDSLYAYARRIFPPDDLYGRYERDYRFLLDISPQV
jgi:hypothetical protein